MYFSQTAMDASEDKKASLPGNVLLASQPDTALGFESVVEEVYE